MVEDTFQELGKVRPTAVDLRPEHDMTSEHSTAVTSHSPNALADVEREIARACTEAKRERASVTLIAVSKTFDAGAITPVIASGQRVFGENRVQEAKSK